MVAKFLCLIIVTKPLFYNNQANLPATNYLKQIINPFNLQNILVITDGINLNLTLHNNKYRFHFVIWSQENCKRIFTVKTF